MTGQDSVRSLNCELKRLCQSIDIPDVNTTKLNARPKGGDLNVGTRVPQSLDNRVRYRTEKNVEPVGSDVIIPRFRSPSAHMRLHFLVSNR